MTKSEHSELCKEAIRAKAAWERHVRLLAQELLPPTTPAKGHMPFPGHRTIAELDALEAKG
jgi:hypothetical protein